MFMWDLENIEKLLRHSGVVMLACVDEAEFQPVFMLQRSDQWSDLDKVGASANNQVKKIWLIC